jgi:hypothetical protein
LVWFDDNLAIAGRDAATTGHEIGYRDVEVFIERRPEILSGAKAWMHIGANIGAAQGLRLNLLQASDDDIESMMADAMIGAGLRIDRRAPRGTVPAGAAEPVHRSGGRYVSILRPSNYLYHNRMDRGEDAVDLNTIERFVGACAMMAKSLAGAFHTGVDGFQLMFKSASVIARSCIDWPVILELLRLELLHNVT